MCQLTFTNINHLKLCRDYLSIQSTINSFLDHQDGFGFFTKDGGLIKSKNTFSMTIGAGEMVEESVKSFPILSHVRKATFTNGNREICAENSHPFETEKLILAHNGSLESKLPGIMKRDEYKKLIDSNIFLLELDKNYEEGMEFIDAFKKTMDDFYGKFAFMIYDKTKDNFYIIRGNTATLYKYDFWIKNKYLGFVVNTDKDSLIKAVLLLINLHPKANITFSDKFITELDKESIYIVKDLSLEKLEFSVRENTKPIVTYHVQETPKSWIDLQKEPSSEISKDAEIVYNFMKLTDLMTYDIDIICNELIGVPLLGLNSEDIKILTQKIIPFLEREFHKNKLKEYRKIKEISLLYNNLITCNKLGLLYPYMMNDIRTLRNKRIELQDANPDQNFRFGLQN